MASLTIRDLDEGLKQRLRIRAAHLNRSMEEEARQILRDALAEKPTPPVDLGQRIRARFSPLGGVELPLAPREAVRTPPDLEVPAGRKRRP
jgi:antitoxin FitA